MGQAMRKFGVPAIVLGGGVTTGLGAIRSLGRAGIDVYYIDDETTEAAYSKYCRKCFILPRRSNSKDELKNALAKLHDSIEYAVLFPGSDSYALNLSELMGELDGYYSPAPKKEATDLLIKKRRFYQSLTKEKIPHPTTYFPQDVEDVREIGRRVLYPIFVKPSVSHLFSQRFRKKGFVANSEGALLRYWTATEREEVEVIIQEIVPGPPHNHVFLDGYIDSDSNPKALFARRRLRMWPLSFGNSSLCMSIPISEIASLKEILFNYLRSINYQGIFSAELKSIREPQHGSTLLAQNVGLT